MILLDTNALIWQHDHHARGLGLLRAGVRVYVSPASVLELQLLTESGRLRLHRGASVRDLAHDDRWSEDNPPSGDWFDVALGIGWTRDPFDRLLVAHARLRRWRLATGDAALFEHLDAHEYLEL